MKKYYITTPIYFPSAAPHVGSSYTTIACDVLARYKRLQGYDVMFATGTDEHGMKIAENAKKAGVTPQEFVDRISDNFKKLWKVLNITNDRFIRTTDKFHKSAIQKIFKELYDKGYIYKSEYTGKYCTPCESFWTESQLKDGKCPECERDVNEANEEAYFFKLSEFGERLEKHLLDNPEFLQPSFRVNEMINNFIRPGLSDLCVSRTSFDWGIPVSFDERHVIYVWIDALFNYTTLLGYQNDEYNDFDKYWPADVHMMAKEIVRFHSLIWPAMLMALDLPLPKRIYAHGWFSMDGKKMSKSMGNVIDPFVLCERYGTDALRYHLMKEMPFGLDCDFYSETLLNRINSDLANDLGNLLSRTVAMVNKYFGDNLPEARLSGEFDDELIGMLTELKGKVETSLDNFRFTDALTDIFKAISRANKYIDETAPWILAKSEENNPRLATVLYNLMETLRITGILLSPFIPDSTVKIFEQIGANSEQTTWETAGKYGVLTGNETVKSGEKLFLRLDVDKEIAELNSLVANNKDKKVVTFGNEPKQKAPVKTAENVVGIITIDKFMETDLRTAEVLTCEKVPKSDKLLKLSVNDGVRERQIVSGIAQWYTPESLIGKKVIIVANLKPAKLRGIESEGMILAADLGTDSDSCKVIFVDSDIPNGAKIR